MMLAGVLVAMVIFLGLFALAAVAVFGSSP